MSDTNPGIHLPKIPVAFQTVNNNKDVDSEAP